MPRPMSSIRGEAWKRLKLRTNSGKTLAIARELAAFRETYAQTKNVARAIA